MAAYFTMHGAGRGHRAARPRVDQDQAQDQDAWLREALATVEAQAERYQEPTCCGMRLGCWSAWPANSMTFPS
jgi:hypothetical protein